MADGEKRRVDKMSNVLVFAPPKICFHQPYKKLRIENQETHDCWDKTTFHFADGKLIKSLTKDHGILEDTSTAEGSCIFLDYDPKLIQESVNSYLDQVFSQSVCSSFVNVDDSCCGQNIIPDNLLESLTELQKEYDNVNYESQVLLDNIIENEDNLLIKEKQRTLKNASLREKNIRRSREGMNAENKTAVLHFEDTHPMTEEDVYTQQKTQHLETNYGVDVGLLKDSERKTKNSLPDNSSSSSSSELSDRQSSNAKDQHFCQIPAASSASESSNEQASASLAKSQHLLQQSAAASLESMSTNQPLTSTKSQSLQRSSSESSSDRKSSAEASSQHAKNKSHCLTLPKISDKLSNLSNCIPGQGLFNICIIVLQVNPVKEIQIKSGRNAGQFIPLSSIIVSDNSRSHFKLTLWRQASTWTEKMVAGDVIVATSIRIEKWRDEYIGQTTFSSSFYNLHQPQKPLSNAWLQIVSQSHLDDLLSWAKSVYGYLFRTTSSTPTVKFVAISELQNNTLVHFRGVLKSVSALTDKSNRNTYRYGTQRLPKIRAIFAQSPKEEICVTLWGRQSDWLDSLRKSEGSVFELRYLAAKHDSVTGVIVLHTTSKSTKNKLDADNEISKQLLSSFKDIPVEIVTFNTIKELFQAKFNGSAEITGKIHSFLLRYKNEALEVDSHNVEALEGWCNRLTYVGCASCSRALKQDKNGIYGQCASCVYRKLGHNYAVKRYFRNVTVRAKDRYNIIDVSVSHKAVCKLFQGMNPDDFCRRAVSGAFVDLVKELLSEKKLCTFVIICKTVVDENSFVVSRNFALIDFKKE